MGLGSFLKKAVSTVASVAGPVLGLVGTGMDANSQQNAANMNADLQREFAQKGIRWKVEDAKAAGIHPLYAMGAQTHSFSPSYVGDTNYGSSMAQVGQDLSRSIDATRTATERKQARLDALTIERGELENTLLRSQIAKLNATPNPPMASGQDNYLIPGQANSAIVVNPSEGFFSSKTNRGVEAATTPANKLYVGYDGRPVLSPSPEYAESLEGNWPVGMIQNLMHNVAPFYVQQVDKAVRRNLSQRDQNSYYNRTGNLK